jgi:hypothetical protein
MKAVSKILTSAAGIAALGMAAPAAAQFPGGNIGSQVIGQVLNTILNPYGQQQRYQQYGQPYGQYGQQYGQQYGEYGQQYGQYRQYGINPQAAVSQCSAAVQSRLAQQFSAGYGYNPYGSGYSSARVVSVSSVQPRSNSTMEVRGYATSGRTAAYNPYGGYNTAAAADLTFECDVDYRGYISDIDIDRRY